MNDVQKHCETCHILHRVWVVVPHRSQRVGMWGYYWMVINPDGALKLLDAGIMVCLIAYLVLLDEWLLQLMSQWSQHKHKEATAMMRVDSLFVVRLPNNLSSTESAGVLRLGFPVTQDVVSGAAIEAVCGVMRHFANVDRNVWRVGWRLQLSDHGHAGIAIWV